MKIVIDGNIGSAKTTQLDLLEKVGYSVQREPIDNWPLEEFYSDPSRWAFYFHMVLLQTLQPESEGLVLLERSLLSSRYVFWPVLLNNRVVTEMEDRTYSEFYEKYAWFPDLYIFLDKRPEIAYRHITTRGQAGDGGVTLDYLEQLEIQYKKMLNNIPCKVIIIDAERSPQEIHEEIMKVLFDVLV